MRCQTRGIPSGVKVQFWTVVRTWTITNWTKSSVQSSQNSQNQTCGPVRGSRTLCFGWTGSNRFKPVQTVDLLNYFNSIPSVTITVTIRHHYHSNHHCHYHHHCHRQSWGRGTNWKGQHVANHHHHIVATLTQDNNMTWWLGGAEGMMRAWVDRCAHLLKMVCLF